MSLICRVQLWVVVISFLAAGAKAQEAKPRQGVFCDTPEQLERVVDWLNGSVNDGERTASLERTNPPASAPATTGAVPKRGTVGTPPATQRETVGGQ